MDPNLVYAKTPTGDEAVRQSTRVVQRNLRMVLVQVDGKTTVEDLTFKIGNARLVESALRELEEGGYIAPTVDAVSVWEESRKAARKDVAPVDMSVMSQFSTFGPKSLGVSAASQSEGGAQTFSSFGKPIFPAASIDLIRKGTSAKDECQTESKPYKQGVSLWRKLVSLLTFVAILLSVMVFYPYENIKPALEGAASRLLNASVTIDKVGISLCPVPCLKLSGVRMDELSGRGGAEVRIAWPLSLLGSPPYKIQRVDISNADLTAERLVSLPFFVAGTKNDSRVFIGKINIEQATIRFGESLTFNELKGELALSADGALQTASFETVDRSLLINAQPGDGGIALDIEGRAWSPVGTQVSFASLQAKGILRKDKLLIRSLDTTFLGGILRGNWLLDWSRGLSMAGDGTLSRLDSRKVGAIFVPSMKLEGEMNGNFHFRSIARDWAGLWGNLDATVNTDITRGIFHGVDLGEAARRDGLSDVRGGATKFDSLSSTLTITPKQIIGRDVKMDAGMVTASGQFFSSRNGVVEGNMAVTMQTSVSSIRTPVRVFGTLPNLSATTRK